jgi:hypothetical protein
MVIKNSLEIVELLDVCGCLISAGVFRASGGRFLGSLLDVLVKWAGSLAR